MPDYEKRDWFLLWCLLFVFAPVVFAVWTINTNYVTREKCTLVLDACRSTCHKHTAGDSRISCFASCSNYYDQCSAK